jgi:hypothetical protein
MPLAIRRVRGAGATIVRATVNWNEVAPTRPRGDAADPGNRAYRWERTDRTVKAAVAAGLVPLLTIASAPQWSLRNREFLRPDPEALEAFARAAARRYSGKYRGLPRVRYWLVWNEPNLIWYLTPQTENGVITGAAAYRRMVNAAYRGIHSVRDDNFVVAGALAPHVNGATPPLDFMRAFFCIKPECKETVSFDAFSVHPYTFGGPTHQPATPGGIGLGNLSVVPRMLRQEQRRGEIVADAPVQFWVTEFSYDSNPPDEKALAFSLQTRWTSQALYQIWKSGATVVTWFLIRDQPLSTPWQSGLYYAGKTLTADRPKPTLRAFRFPFVALVDGRGTMLWGRTPWGRPGSVVVQKSTGGAWRTVIKLKTDRYGIFMRRLTSRSTRGTMRAVLADRSDRSLPFGLKPVPDRHIFPWG